MKVLKFEKNPCTPCKMVDMMMGGLGVSVDEKIDIETNIEMREKYDVMSVPTLVLIDKDGNKVDSVTGIDEDKTIELFKKAGKI